jgi:hypothetical protein
VTFVLLIALFDGKAGHHDFNPPEYLPLDLSCEHLFIEAVQRSRFKPKKPTKKKKFPSILKFVKKTKYISRDDLIFEKSKYIQNKFKFISNETKYIKDKINFRKGCRCLLG